MDRHQAEPPALDLRCGLALPAQLQVLGACLVATGVVLAAPYPAPVLIVAAITMVFCGLLASRPDETRLQWRDGAWWWLDAAGRVPRGPWHAARGSWLGPGLAVVVLCDRRRRRRRVVVHRARSDESSWRLLRVLLRHAPARREAA